MRKQVRATWQTCGGVVLLVAGVFGALTGFRASLAHGHYYRARYGTARDDAAAIARLCEAAHRRYPHNYRFCVWTARRAWEHHRLQPGPRWLSAARDWCDIALVLNPVHRPSRLLKAELLAADSPATGAAYWERYVDWHYWDPRNHAVLLGLYADASAFGKAARTLRLLQGTRYETWGRRRIATAWETARQPPPVPSTP